MTQRSYHQYCPIAHALDLIGERWSLLIVRDLLLGPKRFSDLREGLPGIGTNILTDRLKALEQTGVIARRSLPPPAASAVYELTPYGQALDGPLQALAQWGGRTLGQPQPAQSLSGDSLLLTVRALARQLPALGAATSYAFTLSDAALPEAVFVRTPDGEATLRVGPVAPPDAHITLDLATLFALAGGAESWQSALERGAIRLQGGSAVIASLGG